ncbi:MAG: heme exporter protein CcmD [Stellaceae bacterium]
MSETVAQFLAMGGYAAYVWPAYGLSVAVLGGLLWWSLAAYRRSRRTLERLQGGRAP